MAFQLGDTVDINGDLATVRFIGPTSFSDGLWVGLELEYPKGKNDGCVQGIRYFECRDKFGMFVRPTVLRLVESASPEVVARFEAMNKAVQHGDGQAQAQAGGPARKVSVGGQGLGTAPIQPTPVRPGVPATAGNRMSLRSPVKAASTTPTPRTQTPNVTKAPPQPPSRSSTPGRPGSMPPPPKPPAAGNRRQSTMSGPGNTPNLARTASHSSSIGRPSSGAAQSSNRLSVKSSSTPNLGAIGSGRRASGVGAVSPDSSASERASSGIPAGSRAAPVAKTPQRPGATRQANLMADDRSTREGSPVSPGRSSTGGAMAEREREIDGLKKKIEFLEKKRVEDRDKIPKLEQKCEQLQLERDRFEAIIQKLSGKIQSQAEEVKEMRKSLADAQRALQEMEEIKAESEDLVEMATLDREMAEETAEVLRSELDALRAKTEELEMEVEILREENSELSSDMNPEERTSKGWIQMEKQNERLKDALLRLREITAQAEQELKDTVESYKEENASLAQYKEKYEATAERLELAEKAIEDLRSQLDTAEGAEQMLEDLTEQLMNQNEQIEELKATVEDLESLRELNDELEINHVETEKQMQEEIDYKDLVILDQKRRIDALDAAHEEAEYTIKKFRDLVMSLQSDLEDMRASAQLSEVEAEELSARSRAMMDINLKLKLSAEKAQNKTIDLELGKLETQQAVEHLAIVQMFLPEAYVDDKESVLALLRFKRVAFKARLLQTFVKERINAAVEAGGNEEGVVAACDMSDKLVWVEAMCERFVACMEACTVEQFGRFKGALHELDPVERALNAWIEGLRKDELKESVCATELQRTMALMTHLGELHLTDTLANFSRDIYMRTMLMQSHMESVSSALTYLKTLIQRNLPAEQVNGEEALAFYKKADHVISHSRSAKVIVGKILRGLQDLYTRSVSMGKEHGPSFEECLNITSRLAGYTRALAADIVPVLLSASERADPPSFHEISGVLLRTTERELNVVESDLLNTMAKDLRSLTNLLVDVASLTSEYEQFTEFERPPNPWITIAQNLKAKKSFSAEHVEEIARLREEMIDKTTQLRLVEKDKEEYEVRIELLEARIQTVTALQKRCDDLDKSLQGSLSREKMLENTLREAQHDLAATDSELVKAKKQLEKALAQQQAAAGAAGAEGKEAAVASRREVEALERKISMLEKAVGYYRKMASETRMLPPPWGNTWLETPLIPGAIPPPSESSASSEEEGEVDDEVFSDESSQYSYTSYQSSRAESPAPTSSQTPLNSNAGPAYSSLEAESRAILTSLITLTTSSLPMDLSSLSPPSTRWRRTTATPRFVALRQRGEYEGLRDWVGDVVGVKRERRRVKRWVETGDDEEGEGEGGRGVRRGSGVRILGVDVGVDEVSVGSGGYE